LVLGYSGWEGDVVMSALQRRLARYDGLPRQVYWFLYQRELAGGLPGWLREHRNVVLVAPEETPPDGRGIDSDTALGPASTEGARSTLPAEAVLAQMIEALRVPNPDLFEAPVSALRGRLEGVLGDRADRPSVYGLDSIVARLRRAEELLAAEAAAPSPIEAIQTLAREGHLAEVVDKAAALDLTSLDVTQLRELLEALWPACSQLSGEQELAAEALFVRCADLLPADDPYGNSLEARIRVAQALLWQGGALDQLRRHSEALCAFEEVLTRFGEATERPLQERTAMALLNRGVSLGVLGRPKEAIQACDEVVRRYGEATEPALHELVARAHEEGVRALALGSTPEGDRRLGRGPEPFRRGHRTGAPRARRVRTGKQRPQPQGAGSRSGGDGGLRRGCQALRRGY
jgi:tetratricopeptide (TPR) repeat protein